MIRIKEWLTEHDYSIRYTRDNLVRARCIIYQETNNKNIRIGEWIPIYEIKLIGGLLIFSSVKPDVKMPGFITLNNVYAMCDWQDEMYLNRDSIEYIREIK